MLTNTREFLRDAPWAATFPGIAILLTVVGFNLLGDGLRDALDPRLRQ
jgi:peptide/nickel transport system permease protein